MFSASMPAPFSRSTRQPRNSPPSAALSMPRGSPGSAGPSFHGPAPATGTYSSNSARVGGPAPAREAVMAAARAAWSRTPRSLPGSTASNPARARGAEQTLAPGRRAGSAQIGAVAASLVFRRLDGESWEPTIHRVPTRLIARLRRDSRSVMSSRPSVILRNRSGHDEAAGQNRSDQPLRSRYR